MVRLNIVLLLAVVSSALYLVQVQYDSRRLYIELEKAQAQARKLEIEHERLMAEKRGQATPLRVEGIAKGQLQMRADTPAITQYVTLGGAPAASASKAPSKSASAAVAAPEAAKP